jgi:hypothetical protein
MTTQTNLDLVWAAAAGGGSDTGDTKYQLGWVSEIPNYQNFNFVLSNLSKNNLALAEKGSYEWQTEISYELGATTKGSDGLFYTCLNANVSEDPISDILNNFWTLGKFFGSGSYAATEGVKICNVNPRSLNAWTGSDQTLRNQNAILALTTEGTSDNWLFANVNGEPLLVNVGNSSPDGRTISLGSSGAYKVYSDNYKPVADKWTTSRTLTYTLNGDVSGTASMAVDGGSNKALTMTVSVNNDSHSHSNSTITSLDAAKLTGNISDSRLPDMISSNITGNAATASALFTGRNISMSGDVTGSASFNGSANISINCDISGAALPAANLTGTISVARLPSYITASVTGNAGSATKLQTARTISLGGDITGSASFDGSGNITITTSVGNDNHTHDGRYFTETEANSRFAYKAGAGTQAFAAATITCSRLNSTGEVSGNFTSDIRLKSNLKPIRTAISKVKSLRTVSYDKQIGDDSKFEVGIIAQDVEKIFPHMVKEQGGVKRVAQGGNEFAALAFAAIKELSAKVEKLEKQLKEK